MVSSPLLREKPVATKVATRCPEAADLSVSQLTAIVTSPLAGCFGSTNPDDWFPIAARTEQVRTEAARALRLCAACPVRAPCLELSMRLWKAGGKHGIWGGLIPADRAEVHRQWLAGTPVKALLENRLQCYRNASAPQAKDGLHDRGESHQLLGLRSFSSRQPPGSGW